MALSSILYLIIQQRTPTSAGLLQGARPNLIKSVKSRLSNIFYYSKPQLHNYAFIALLYSNQKQKSSIGLLRYGTELFFALYSSKNIPYRIPYVSKNTVRNNTGRNFFRTVIPCLSVPHFSTNLRQEKFSTKLFHCLVKVQIYHPSI